MAETLTALLTKRQYRRFLLYYVIGKSQSEIARIENVTQQAVSCSLVSARLELGEKFSEFFSKNFENDLVKCPNFLNIVKGIFQSLRTLKIEDTMMPVQTLCDSSQRDAAMTVDAFCAEPERFPSASDPELANPACDDSTGTCDLQPRPPTDLRGSTAMYASLTSGGKAVLGQSCQGWPASCPDRQGV